MALIRNLLKSAKAGAGARGQRRTEIEGATDSAIFHHPVAEDNVHAVRAEGVSCCRGRLPTLAEIHHETCSSSLADQSASPCRRHASHLKPKDKHGPTVVQIPYAHMFSSIGSPTSRAHMVCTVPDSFLLKPVEAWIREHGLI